jgi:hypothetical protein
MCSRMSPGSGPRLVGDGVSTVEVQSSMDVV